MFNNNLSMTDIINILEKRPGDKLVHTFYWDSKNVVRLTNSDLLRQVYAVIKNIGQKISADEQLVVGLMFENNPLIPSLMIGLMACGCLIVPINPSGHPSDIEYIVKNTNVKYMILDNPERNFDGSMFDNVPVMYIKDVTTCDTPEIPELPHYDPSRPSFVIHTSGTTSKPKGVVLSVLSILNNAQLIANKVGLDNSNQLTTLPMYHVHALLFGVFSSLMTGSHLVVLKRFEVLLWLRVVKSEKINWTSIVPSLLPLLCVSGIKKENCPDLKGIIVSSAPIHESMAKRFESASSIPLLQAWGQTEFTCWATCCDSGIEGNEYDGQLRSVGAPLPGVNVSVINTDGAEAGEHEPGELYLSGPYIMLGYHNEKTLTDQVINEHGLNTGDIGYYKSINNKKYYFITGRNKEFINKSGEKISPLSVEDEIYRQYPDVAGYVAVVGFDHNVVGEEIGICVDAKIFDTNIVDEDRFVNYLKNMHASFRPNVIYISNASIPKTFTGKLQRMRLKDKFRNQADYFGEQLVIRE